MSIENYLARRAQMQNQNLQAVQNSLDGLLATYFEHSLAQKSAKLNNISNSFLNSLRYSFDTL